jgi:hypothetical protein
VQVRGSRKANPKKISGTSNGGCAGWQSGRLAGCTHKVREERRQWAVENQERWLGARRRAAWDEGTAVKNGGARRAARAASARGRRGLSRELAVERAGLGDQQAVKASGGRQRTARRRTKESESGPRKRLINRREPAQGGRSHPEGPLWCCCPVWTRVEEHTALPLASHDQREQRHMVVIQGPSIIGGSCLGSNRPSKSNKDVNDKDGDDDGVKYQGGDA